MTDPLKSWFAEPRDVVTMREFLQSRIGARFIEALEEHARQDRDVTRLGLVGHENAEHFKTVILATKMYQVKIQRLILMLKGKGGEAGVCDDGDAKTTECDPAPIPDRQSRQGDMT